MKHFMQLTEESLKELFFLRATSVNTSEKEMLASSLGASIYCPLDSDNVIERLKKLEKYGATSIILDLEDGIDFQKLEFAEENLKKVLDYIEKLEQNNKNHPYFFVRPRSPYHLADLLKRLGHSMRFLTGAALPKFEGSTSNKQDESQKFEASASGYNYLSVIKKFNQSLDSGHSIFGGMPIIESESIANVLFRLSELGALRELANKFHDVILCFRVGATDISAFYGIRRSKDFTIYQSQLLSNPLIDVVSVLSDSLNENSFYVSGAVWEHFSNKDRLFKPQLRASPFEKRESNKLRTKLLLDDMDGLIREVELDKINGFFGKTVIHPSHIALVNSLYVVPYEEYQDALDVLSRETGVGTSENHDKMNESAPHRNWAEKIMLRAQIYGVYNAGKIYIDCFELAQEVFND